MTTTDSIRPSWMGAAPPADDFETWMRTVDSALLPGGAYFGGYGWDGLISALTRESRVRGLRPVTKADIEAETARRAEVNRDPAATPSDGAFQMLTPGDQGRAMAARRFGTKPDPAPTTGPGIGTGQGLAMAEKRFGTKQ